MAEQNSWHTPARDAVHIWRVPLDGPLPPMVTLLDSLAQDERARAARFRFERDRRRYVVTRAALRALLSNALSIAPAAVQFVYGQQGKPALAAAHGAAQGSDVQFNVAHSHEVALIALSRGVPVGVDVEHARPLTDMMRIARRFFSTQEVAALAAAETAAQAGAHTFFRIWSRKEAFIKATGKGLSQPLGSFNVMAADGTPLAFVELEGATVGRTTVGRATTWQTTAWQLWDLDVGAGYGAALVAWRGDKDLKLQQFPYRLPGR